MKQNILNGSAAGEEMSSAKAQVAATAFLRPFSLVGLSFYGLPFFYDFMVKDLAFFEGSRAAVTSGNAFGKIVVGPLFGFLAGWIIDRFGPRRLMMAGILMGGLALVGLSQMTALWMFYFFYLFNALGYVCGGPLPNQVLLSRWFDKARGKAMGFAYIGIGVGGMVASTGAMAERPVRLASGVDDARRTNDSHWADGLVRQRAARRLRRAKGGAAAADRRHPQEAGFLPARRRQHVLDRGGRRHRTSTSNSSWAWT